MRLAFCAVAVIALACLLIRAGRLGMAGDYLDPFGHIGAQDESLYAHSAIQMAQHGGWMTPTFMGRLGLYKPPLLAAMAGLSARVLGISRISLRLPVALLAALAVGLVFWWAAEVNGWLAGACAVLLLISDHLWHTLASMCLTDGLLAAFYVAALYCLFADPWLDTAWSRWGYAGAVAASILTKSVAGLLPLGVLGLYWIFAPPKYRPRFWRLIGAVLLSLALAAPWFLFQLLAHGRWFWAEHIGVEILGFGAGAPPQTSQENQALFYGVRMALLDPVLLAAAAASLPTFAREIRRRSAPAILLLLAMMLPAAAVLIWQYRNVSYLLPLIPMLAIFASAYNPLCAANTAKWTLAALVAIFVVKAAAPATSWGLPFRTGTVVAAAPILEDYCERARGNELIVVDTPDELYASLLPIPRVRYVLSGAAPAAGTYGLDFASMGIILNEQQFDALPQSLPAFEKQLREWGMDSTDAVGTVVFVSSPAELAAVVAAHPDSDFLLPARDRVVAGSPAHIPVRVGPEYLLLLARLALPATRAKWSCRL